MVYDVLIIFENGFEKVIDGVSNYGINKETGCFYFEKNGYRSFVPKDNVVYFGRRFDWGV